MTVSAIHAARLAVSPPPSEDAAASVLITPPSDARLLEELSRCVFEAGFDPARVERRWEGIREALRRFDVEAVAALPEDEAAALLEAPGMIRNRAKIRAVIDNARVIRRLAEERGSLAEWLLALPTDPVVRGTALTSVFRGVGPWAAREFLARQRAWLPG